MKATVFKKTFSLLLALLLLLPLVFSVAVNAQGTNAASEVKGATFATNITYTTSLVLDTTPMAFEATIKLPKDYTGRAGVIFGNYASNGISGISFELAAGCKPRLYCTAPNVTWDCTFGTALPTGEDVHIAVTIDNGKANLYVNGSSDPVESKTLNSGYLTVLPTAKYMVGGDLRGGNAQYFKGEIKNVAVYSAPLSAAEIKDCTIDYSSSNLLCAYDLTGATVEERIKDRSKNGVDLIYSDPTYDKTELSKALTFTSSDTYKMDNNVSSSPVTFEAEIFLPTGVTDRGGIILGNYSMHAKTVNLEIYTGGNPRLYFEGFNGTLYDFTFKNVDIRGTWVKLAIVLDAPNGLVHCYVNGKLRQTIDNGAPIEIDNYETYDSPLYLGRDTRGSDGRPFLGAIKSLALYDDVRSSEEILADASRYDLTNDSLIAAYYFTEESGRNDLSNNANHIHYNGEVTNPPAGGDNEGGSGDNEGGGNQGGGTEGGGNSGGSGITTLNGMTFENGKYAFIDGSFANNAPLTIEATVLIPTTETGRVGVIVGNYNDNSNYFSFEVLANGVPRFCLPSSTNGVVDIKFDRLHINTGEVVHLTLTYDPTTGLAYCYINDGTQYQKATLTKYTYHQDVFSTLLVMGNDLRKGSAQYFKGTIGSLAIYSDTRSADEVALDYTNGINLNDDNLVVYYDLTGKSFGDEVNNQAGDKYDIAYKSKTYGDTLSWFDGVAPTDFLYSFAVVGDTQIIAQNYSSQFHMIYDWILENSESKKIGYVFGLGDITNGSSTSEWNVATENIFRLNGVIPYSVVRGNHDKLGNFNNAFATNAYYTSQFNGFYQEGDVTNSWRKITVGGVNYLMITLDYGASDAVLEWAGSIIENNPDYKVIITTHAYLYRDGTTLDQGDVCPPATTGGYNNGDHLWNKLISQHENIFLVLSGHDPSAKVVMTQQTGVHGNLVTQFLVDPQGVDASGVPTGMVTMLYFKADGSVEVETYSTIQEKHYKVENQFVIEETAHDYEFLSIGYENGYMQEGKADAICKACDHEHTLSCEPLFIFSGYSVREGDYSAICAGYTVNYALLEKYQLMNGTEISIGMVASSSTAPVIPGKPVSSDGTASETTGGKIVSYLIEDTQIMFVDIILKSANWEVYKDKEVILCAFILEKGTVGYICDTDEITDTASAISYSQIKAQLY